MVPIFCYYCCCYYYYHYYFSILGIEPSPHARQVLCLQPILFLIIFRKHLTFLPEPSWMKILLPNISSQAVKTSAITPDITLLLICDLASFCSQAGLEPLSLQSPFVAWIVNVSHCVWSLHNTLNEITS
jgi:hypothetical protein